MLGDSHRGNVILDLNSDLIDDPVHLTTGQLLKLPDDARTSVRRTQPHAVSRSVPSFGATSATTRRCTGGPKGVTNRVHHFILAALERAKLHPAPEANK